MCEINVWNYKGDLKNNEKDKLPKKGVDSTYTQALPPKTYNLIRNIFKNI